MGCTTLREWINQYRIHGISAFITCNGNKKYSKELKIQCVEAVLSGEGSVDDIMLKYGISSRFIAIKHFHDLSKNTMNALAISWAIAG